MAIHVKGPTYDGTDPASNDAKRVDDLDFVLERASTADKGKVPFLNASGYLPQSVQGTKSVSIECFHPATVTAPDATNACGLYLVPAQLSGFMITGVTATVYDLNGSIQDATVLMVKKAPAATAPGGSWVNCLSASISIAFGSYNGTGALTATIADRTVATNDKIEVICSAITAIAPAKGLFVTIEFEKRDSAGA
jgi:hypothetical protein